MTYLYIGAGALVLLAIAYTAAKGPANVGKAIGKAASDLAGGAVQGVLSGVGVPETDDAKCKACLAARDWLGILNYCPAGTSISAASSAVHDRLQSIFGANPAQSSSYAAPAPSMPAAVTPPKADWENRLEGVWL